MHNLIMPSPDPPEKPYKSLYNFEIEDVGIFFGRDETIGALYRKVLANRLVVLHGRSGAGKTSLLKAGLAPRLISEGRLPIFTRAYDDPVTAVKRAIIPETATPWPDLLFQLTLHQFLGLACGRLSSQTRELVIILDQFEEFFIRWPDRRERQPFIDAVTECYGDTALPVRFIFAVRKEYFSDLAELQGRIPMVLRNECWLGPMTREQAASAIVGPTAKVRRPLTYEPALLDTLLGDLTRGGLALTRSPSFADDAQGAAGTVQVASQSTVSGPVLSPVDGIEPLRLQLICTQLYDASAEFEGEVTITLASYEKLGRAAGMPSHYLEGVLNRLPKHEQPVAREVLKELVSATATRRILSDTSLADRIEVEKAQLDDVLSRLVDARTLRSEEVGGETLFELAHECLVAEIQLWIGPDELAFKQVQHLLRRDVANWRASGTFIPRERLELFHTHWEHLQGVNPEARECLLRSSLATGFAIEDWAKLAGLEGEKLLLTALNDRRQEIRRAVMGSLAAIWWLPELSGLGEDDPEVRLAAAEALGEIGNYRTVVPLITVLQDAEPRVRQAVARALGQFGDLRSLGPLIAVLGDDDPSVRQATAIALGKLGDVRAIDSLTIALRDRDPDVRRAAICSLGLIWELPELARLGEADRYVGWAAAGELAKLGDPRAVAPLIAVLQDEHRGVRRAAAEALVELGEPAVEPLIGALREEDSDARRWAAWALGEMGHPRAIEPLSATLRDTHDDVRQAAADALAKLGEPAVTPLVAALKDADPKVRRRAAGVLAESDHIGVVEPLVAALGDWHTDVRQAAAEALVKLGQPAVGPLVIALWDENRGMRRAAAAALGEIGDRRAVGPLVDTLHDEDGEVRRAAAAALEKIGDSRAIEPFIAALNDANRYVRREISWALGEFGDSRAIKPLIATLRDEDRGVRQAAASALVKLGTPAVEPLGTALTDAGPEARWAIVGVLGELGNPRAIEPLLATMPEADSAVRRAVAEALAKIGDERVLEPLIGLLQDQDSSVRWTATGALGQLGDSRAIEPLEAALQDEDSSVRRGASDALQKIGTKASDMVD